MKINNQYYRSIFLADDGISVCIFDQKKLPWHFEIVTLKTYQQAAVAISDMTVRGAPLLAMTGAYGMALAMLQDCSDEMVVRAYDDLVSTRPTAVNLKWALDIMKARLLATAVAERVKIAYQQADDLCQQDTHINHAIGMNGLQIIEQIVHQKQQRGDDDTVHILTHCNAGWLATTDYGTATAPLYLAHDKGIKLHIWVDETRPRNQGLLTAFELKQHGVPHSVIADNTGGLLMQQNKVDMCIVGADRVTANGDVCNKIGTYLKALAANVHDVPFYVALPSPTIDYNLPAGHLIHIEERQQQEITTIYGLDSHNQVAQLSLTDSPAYNPAFDVTPARYITGYITETGILTQQDFKA